MVVKNSRSEIYQIGDEGSGYAFSEAQLNGAVKLSRTILVGGKPTPYEYFHQVESGPCATLTFTNLWSLVHGNLPNIASIHEGLIDEGTTDEVWTHNFSLIHGNNPNNEEFKVALGLQPVESRHTTASTLFDFLDTIDNGSIICGTQSHCNAIHHWGENQYVLVEPNDIQGLKVLTRKEVINYIEARFINNPSEPKDYFYFIGPTVNLE